MMKKILVFFIIIVFFGCDNSEENKDLCSYYNTTVRFSVLNSEHEDLLNPKNPNYLDVSKIKLFNVINGKTVEFYDPNLDSPRNFKILKYDYDDVYHIIVFLNYIDKSAKTATYIQWDEKDTDTLESTFNKTKCSTITNQVWLNGKLVWDYKMDDKDYPIIIK